MLTIQWVACCKKHAKNKHIPALSDPKRNHTKRETHIKIKVVKGDSESCKPTSQVFMSNTLWRMCILLTCIQQDFHHIKCLWNHIWSITCHRYIISSYQYQSFHPQTNEWILQWPMSTHVQSSLSNPSSKSQTNSISWSHAFTMAPVQGVDGQVKPCQTTKNREISKQQVEWSTHF